MGIVAWIIVGLLAGWLATQIPAGMEGYCTISRWGLWAPSLVASFLKSFDWKSCRISGGILITATIGAIVFLLIWRAIRKA